MTIRLVPARAGDLRTPDSFILAGVAGAFTDPQAGRRAVGEVLDTITKHLRPEPWGAYWAVEGTPARAVGLCAFKSAPDSGHEVEIAYYTFPAIEGRGVATAMAAALIEIASAGCARAVIAHTLPVENASGVVLRRNGFEFMGPAQDPEDGLVWAWRRSLV